MNYKKLYPIIKKYGLLTAVLVYGSFSLSTYSAKKAKTLHETIAQVANAKSQTQTQTQTNSTPGTTTPNRVITPMGGPNVKCGTNLYVAAELIYWNVREDGLSYTASGMSNGTSVTDRGSFKQIDWEYDLGFKAIAGYHLPHDGWDVLARYTYLRSNPTSSTSSQSVNSNLIPLWNIGANFTNFQVGDNSLRFAKGEWDLDFNTVDLELGRNFMLSRRLKMRPFIGLKGSWIDQDYKVTYTVQDVIADPIETYQMKNDQDTSGVGLRAGFNSAWQFSNYFSLYGNFGITALWNKFDIDRKDTFNESGSTQTQINIENDFYTIKPVIELGIGLRLDYYLADNRYHLRLQAGWEEQYWAEFNQLFKLREESAHGDLNLQGLDVKVRFDF